MSNFCTKTPHLKTLFLSQIQHFYVLFLMLFQLILETKSIFERNSEKNVEK